MRSHDLKKKMHGSTNCAAMTAVMQQKHRIYVYYLMIMEAKNIVAPWDDGILLAVAISIVSSVRGVCNCPLTS